MTAVCQSRRPNAPITNGRRAAPSTGSTKPRPSKTRSDSAAPALSAASVIGEDAGVLPSEAAGGSAQCGVPRHGKRRARRVDHRERAGRCERGGSGEDCDHVHARHRAERAARLGVDRAEHRDEEVGTPMGAEVGGDDLEVVAVVGPDGREAVDHVVGCRRRYRALATLVITSARRRSRTTGRPPMRWPRPRPRTTRRRADGRTSSNTAAAIASELRRGGS